MPVSTTHGLVGALMGAGFTAAGTTMNFTVIGSTFFVPLLVSPLIAALASFIVYLFFTTVRKRIGITKDSCLCIEQTVGGHIRNVQAQAMTGQKQFSIVTGNKETCAEHYSGTVLGISAQKILDHAHYLSAGAVSFARGLNDTPKMAGLLLLVHTLDIRLGVLMLAAAIAIGGLLNARKVGETMGRKITTMNHGQGFTANMVTALMVSTASFSGLPVSTTHVSVGALFGIGSVARQANIRVISGILFSWLLTLPVAALISGLIYVVIR